MDKLEARINSQGALTEYCQRLVDFWLEHKWINITASAKRSLDQNRAIRECYKQIRKITKGGLLNTLSACANYSTAFLSYLKMKCILGFLIAF